jgi:hypothetical protein
VFNATTSRSQRARLGQQVDMPGVDEVEASVGETDPEPLRSPSRHTRCRLLACRGLPVGRHQSLQVQPARQFLTADRRGALLADGNRP